MTARTTLQEHKNMLARLTQTAAIADCSCRWRETTNSWVRVSTGKDCPEHSPAAVEAFRREHGGKRACPAGECNGYGEVWVGHCTCGSGPGGYYGIHEPGCGAEPCPAGCEFVPRPVRRAVRVEG
jgi:hypothetical protein